MGVAGNTRKEARTGDRKQEDNTASNVHASGRTVTLRRQDITELDTGKELSVPVLNRVIITLSVSFIWLPVQHDARKTLIALEFKGIWPICLVCTLGAIT